MENFFELRAHCPKEFRAVHTYYNGNNEVGVVSFVCGEGVTKRSAVEATVRKVKCYTTNHNFCVALIMEKSRKDHGKSWRNHGI